MLDRDPPRTLPNLLEEIADQIFRARRGKNSHAKSDAKRLVAAARRDSPRLAREIERRVKIAETTHARNEEAAEEIRLANLQRVTASWDGSAWIVKIGTYSGPVEAGRVYPLAGETYLALDPRDGDREVISLAHAIETLATGALLDHAAGPDQEEAPE